MYDINHIHVSGTVEAFRRVQTSTNTPMATFRLRCWQELIKVVAFKELAESLALADGERVEVRGRIQSTSWQAADGTWRNGFQVVAQEIGEAHQQEASPKLGTSNAGGGGKGLSVYSDGPF